MNTKNVLAVTALCIAVQSATGCKDERSVASPACVGAEKINDPKQKAEMLKKCPRIGPAFKRSAEVRW